MPQKKSKSKPKSTTTSNASNPLLNELEKLIASLSTLPDLKAETHLTSFIEHLTHAPPSQPAPVILTNDGDGIDLAHASLRGVLEIMMYPCSQEYFLELESEWKAHIWPWMTYLHTNAIRILSLPSNLEKKGVKDFWGRVYATNLNILFSIAHTKGPLHDLVLELYTQVLLGQSWAAETMHNGVPSSSSPTVRIFAPTPTLIGLLDHGSQNQGLYIGLGGGDPVKAAQVALKRIEMNLRSPRDAQQVYGAFMKDVMNIAHMSQAIPAFQLALLEEGGIPAICKALGTLANMPARDLSLMPLITQCIRSCLLFLNIHLTATEGVPWCRQAIKHDLIDSILMSSRWPLIEVDFNIIGMILTYRLTPHLLYLSVLTAAQEALVEIDNSRSVAQAMLHRSGGRLWNSWESFRVVVRDRMLLKEDAEATGFIRSCERVECTETGKRQTFRQCAGCSIAYYCSKQCQSKDWPSHRASCKDRQAREKSQFFPLHQTCLPSPNTPTYPTEGLPLKELSNKDTRFLHFVVSHDLQENGKPIPITGWTPDTNALTFKVDYIVTPPEITIAESRQFMWATPDDRGGRTTDEITNDQSLAIVGQENTSQPGSVYARHVERAEASKGKLQVLVISLPRGDQERNIMTTVHIPGRVEEGMWIPEEDVDDMDMFALEGGEDEGSEGALVQYMGGLQVN